MAQTDSLLTEIEMNPHTVAVERRIAEMIRSARAKRSKFSIYNRVKEAAIDGRAKYLATIYTQAPPTFDELTRNMNLWLASAPQSFYTSEEVAAQSRQRLVNENTPRVIHDITPAVLNSMTAAERLNLANGGGLPERFKLKLYSDDDET
jgi:hypothetical protein